MLRTLLLALFLVLGVAVPAGAEPFGRGDDPFGRQASGSAEASRGTATEAQVSGPVAWIGRAFLSFQRESNRLIQTHMRAIRNGETTWPLIVGFGLAFLYGILHALGPGHGKLVVVSYFLSREAQIGRGLWMGLQIAIFHVISAMVVVVLADVLLRRTFGGPPADVPGVRALSYGIIALIGMAMLVQAIRNGRKRAAGQTVATCCHYDHGHHHGRAETGALALGVGIVPCTGAILILLYAMANGILLQGLVLASAIAIGMAITMGGLGILSIAARGFVASRVENGMAGGRLAAVSEWGGALLITALGTGLLLASL